MNAPVLALISVLAAFTGSTTQAAEIDGCSFISAPDVEAVTGEKLQRRPRVVRRSLGVETHGCNYRSENFAVEVRLETGRSADDVKMYLQALGVTGKGISKQTRVNGIGDQAWWGPVNPTNGILTVVRGNDILWVQTYGKGPGAGSLEKTRAIMEKVLAQYQKVRT